MEAVTTLAGGNERILFVDDEGDLWQVAERMLVHLGYSVVCCESGEIAL
jgi:CheY-like chemotaxis protein